MDKCSRIFTAWTSFVTANQQCLNAYSKAVWITKHQQNKLYRLHSYKAIISIQNNSTECQNGLNIQYVSSTESELGHKLSIMPWCTDAAMRKKN